MNDHTPTRHLARSRAAEQGERMNETIPADERTGLRSEIKQALNRASAENGSDTPDHVLADYLLACLDAFDAATHARSDWYGHHHQQIAFPPAEDPVPPSERSSR